MEGIKKTYNEQYEKWVPWLEDMFLRYFTKDNKASYATKGTWASMQFNKRSTQHGQTKKKKSSLCSPAHSPPPLPQIT